MFVRVNRQLEKKKKHTAELKEACSRWYAPVLSRFGSITYANIYCKLCDGMASYDPEELCVTVEPIRNTLCGPSLRMTIAALVDKRSIDSVKPAGNDECGKNMVKHISKVSETSNHCVIKH